MSLDHSHAPSASMPVPEERDPRMPRLTLAPGFVRTMGAGWGDPDRSPALTPGAAAAAAAHRARLSEALPGRRLSVGAGRAPVRANDTVYEFRADSDFLWLVGAPIEDAVLVMEPAGSGHVAVLYLPAPFRPGDEGFFASALRGELWVGPMPGLAEYAEALSLRTRPLEELHVDEGTLQLAGTASPGIASVPRSTELARTLSELRMIKDPWEIAQLRAAVDHTVAGFAATVGEIPTAIAGGGERWLQGTFDRHARTAGNGPGYATIVGSGARASILHWVRAEGAVDPEAALLLDMGVEERTGYTADITRTFPASGSFTAVQRQVHDLVERAHRAALAAVGPGRAWSDFHVASMEVLAQGLHDWGLLDVSVDEAMSPDGQQHRRFIVCGVGHHVGLDVHDCASSGYAAYQGSAMRDGMVLAVEPGLYFHAFDESLPPELRGIGVRLEDDVLITGTGAEVLSSALPIDATGIEEWMRTPR
ncbi:aminopeptidase P family protein [Microbacterium azadirachtae]|uniref:Xaa-Pro aminopeptidase n=1 Tax=Microbacterium azadirachtae TaxID=582680 RepID=A0A0F0LFL5_9MICO|nr:aminopeptidase P family protein [Microbacterium azadirachtae]KJL31923.1 Xaa-Pro aminopeptidase 1 [Microbacterium azadirachtae]